VPRRGDLSAVATTSGEGPLVGRVRELSELRAAYDHARAGRGGVHLVLGDPGVGKTRLAAALAEHAGADGATIVWTRGWGRAAPAYWPWVEVVRGLCVDVDGETLRRELGASADELLRLAPELADRLPAAQRPPRPLDAGAEASEIARFTLFDALVSLLRARSAVAPVVVLIDDLQAVDEGSLVALDFVSRMLRDLAVLLVVTMHERVPGRSPGAQAALSNIVRAGRRLVLGGLTSDDVGELIELTSGIEPAPELALAVHARTEGNAFFAREILALLLAEGRLEDPPAELPLPDGVRETIRRRLEPLDEQAVQTLELAAILGRTFALSALEHACPLDRDRVLTALDSAAELGLVQELPATVGQYRFGHGLIGDTLLAGMSGAERMAAHGAAGEALEHVYRGAIDAHLDELAHHFLSAAPRGDLHKAVDYAQRGAQRALESLAYEQAAELFSRALEVLELLGADIPRRAALLLGLGTALSRAGRPGARATFEQAIAAARAIGAHDTFARAALGAGPFALTPGHVDDAHVALLVEALERIGPGDDPLRVRLLGSLATALYWSDAAPRRVELAQEALEMAARLGDDVTLAFALSSGQLATCGPDNTVQGLEWLRTLFELSERAGESTLTLDARSRHVDLLLELDELSGADMAIETAERLATAARDRRAMAFVPLQRARRVTIEGRFGEARRLLADVAAISGELPDTTIPLSVDSQLVVLNWIQGGPRSIGEHVRSYADGMPAMPVWRAALAAALADSGRTAEAQLEFDRLADDDFAALPRDNVWFGAMAALTEAVAVLGLPDRARELHAQLAPFAGRNVVTPTVAFLGPVEMWLGILARVAGDIEQALGHLARARAAATRNGDRMSVVRIAVEEAATLVDHGGAEERVRAEELVAQAGAECEDMGRTSVLDQIVLLRERMAAGRAHSRGGATPPVARAVPATPAPASGEARHAAPRGGATLRRVGDVWTIDDGRTRLHLNDGRGVRLLALLLAHPGTEIHSLDLVAIVDGTAPAGRIERSGEQETGRFGVQGAAGPRLDATAKAAYRKRMAKLRAEVADAEKLGDATRAGRAREELEFVSRELGLAVGLGGRDRSDAGSHAERARVNVTRAIRSTLKRIAGYDARLGRELEGAVKTGTFCVYEPDPQRPLRWTVEDA
jgi:tetratricopeptide (TPR) repeat protein